MKILQDGHIAMVRGFRAAGIPCGIKNTEGCPDLAMVVSEVPCRAAAVFTRNRVAAAPVKYDRRLLQEHNTIAQALVVNSGCANACTGERGLQDAEDMARHAAEELGLQPQAVWVMSTGVIGQHLPMDKIRAGITTAVEQLSNEGGHSAARAIMTTDTRPKEVALQMEIAGKPCTIAGVCKGSGMIHPDMATMLAAIVTDALVAPDVLQTALSTVTEKSFNMTTVDGDTSTNDTLLLLANGLSGNNEITSTDDLGYTSFLEGLTCVAQTLSKMIAADGEGATKLVEITVQSARDFKEAKTVAKAIAHSPLVKTAMYGEDANWGRVLCAAGYSGVDIDPDKVALWFGDLQLFKDGAPHDVDEERAAEILSEDEIKILVDLGRGDAEATVWTCDLSHDYVSINAHYRT
jgi:glutamate N-acetyltransferase/amino-acid N-acetyltransferase